MKWTFPSADLEAELGARVCAWFVAEVALLPIVPWLILDPEFAAEMRAQLAAR